MASKNPSTERPGIVWIETRKWRRHDRLWIGFDCRKDEGCTVYGHYDARGVMHIDRVEMDGKQRA